MLGSLTTLANQSLRLVEGAMEQLAPLDGTVVRLRLERPAMVLYVLLHEDGVEFLQYYEGRIDIHLRAPLGALLQFLLLPDPSHMEGIRLQGDKTLLKALGDLLDYCSFWAVARGWLDHYVRFNDLLSLLGREDPVWLASLQGLPEEIRQLSLSLAQQQLLQEDVLAEVRSLRRQLRQQRRLDIFCLTIGLLLLFAAMATQGGNLPTLFLHQALLLASLGGALLLSRLSAPG
jgi:ubiquinone biosynthesis protein UbiJ